MAEAESADGLVGNWVDVIGDKRCGPTAVVMLA
jgi:hypothetical protein